MKESKKTVKDEIKYMQKGGAPKPLVKDERAELKEPAKKPKAKKRGA